MIENEYKLPYTGAEIENKLNLIDTLPTKEYINNLVGTILPVTPPNIGANGNWYIDGTDTGVKARGENGITPHIGVNGNWFIGETDTGVKAEGKDGESGSSAVYSTEETVVGTWIDGKPLYRRVVLGTTPTGTGSSNAVQLADTTSWLIDTCVSILGIVQASSNGSAKLPVGRLLELTIFASRMLTCALSSEGNVYRSMPVTCIIEYTKLSDTATVAIPSATALMESYEQGVNEA